MRFGSVCSGIEAASLAFEPLGWEPVFFSEMEAFPCAVLAHRWPDVPNLGDMTEIDGRQWRGKIDVLVGGTPCQAFSIAGLRQGLGDARGNLTLVFAELADAIKPSVVLWENVPGVLSDKTNAFGCLLGALGGEDDPLQPPGGKWTNAGFVLGPERAIAWRVLDAQYFGVAQRRRRVFLVACPRDGADPRAILFEYEGLRRDTAPSREAGKGVAPTIRSGAANGGRGNGARSGDSKDELIAPCRVESVAVAIQDIRGFDKKQNGKGWNDDGTAYTVDAMATQGVAVAFTQNQCGDVLVTPHCPSIGTNSNATGRNTPKVMAFAIQERACAERLDVGPQGSGINIDVAYTLEARNKVQSVSTAMQVRRLTPTECERLQGMPDGHTQIPWRGKPAEECPDGPRYKAVGNSMAVPCMRWIGQRIAAMCKENR